MEENWASELARPALIPGQRERDRKFADSPLEGSGFEPPVARFISKGFEMEWMGSYRCRLYPCYRSADGVCWR